ncbi:hypothetical protein ACQPW1_10095 [Nocardia sp. CA-128927]|uniref:hypothetical protein n=1 Tax=Nocardia sp. CA-128927 TaxID=3239975 RepID=UPI003D959974
MPALLLVAAAEDSAAGCVEVAALLALSVDEQPTMAAAVITPAIASPAMALFRFTVSISSLFAEIVGLKSYAQQRCQTNWSGCKGNSLR